jgi:Predicted membrane protein (DUF2142)
MLDELGRPTRRGRGLLVGGLVAGIALCWVLITPPGAGADEPSHLVRAGALARGDLDGVDVAAPRFEEVVLPGSFEGFELPGTYAVPDPLCYAFRPLVSVGCAAETGGSDAVRTLPSSADEYPIWGHLPSGLLSRLPGLAPIWWARVGGAGIATALVASALWLTRDRPLGSAGILVALTPMAWGMFAVVNPSAIAIAGAVALWTALLFAGAQPVASAGWLTALGWAALALPRRDGLIWACAALVVALGQNGPTAAEWWRSLGVGPRTVIVASTMVTIGWGITSDSRVSQLVVLAPLIVGAAEVVRWWWRTRAPTTGARVVTVFVVVAIGIVAAAVVVTSRPGGWDGDLADRVVDETGNNLIEALGVLGWLDTWQPAASYVLAVGTVGLLGAASLLEGIAALRWACALLLGTIAASWIFELYGGDTRGLYWQGRYSLPLLAGVPLLLGGARVPPAVAARVARVAGCVALVVVNVAAWAAARRWGVGTQGSLMPWDWDTIHSPVAPIVVLTGLAVLSAGLAAALWRTDESPDSNLGGSETERVAVAVSSRD